jgi:hypothetical protein
MAGHEQEDIKQLERTALPPPTKRHDFHQGMFRVLSLKI